MQPSHAPHPQHPPQIIHAKKSAMMVVKWRCGMPKQANVSAKREKNVVVKHVLTTTTYTLHSPMRYEDLTSNSGELMDRRSCVVLADSACCQHENVMIKNLTTHSEQPEYQTQVTSRNQHTATYRALESCPGFRAAPCHTGACLLSRQRTPAVKESNKDRKSKWVFGEK